MSLGIQVAAEQAIIGELYLSPGESGARLNEVYSIGLRPEHFTLGLARDAYRAFLAIPPGTTPDTVSVVRAVERLKLNVPNSFFATCMELASGGSLRAHAEEILQAARIRELKTHCSRFISDSDALPDLDSLKAAAEALSKHALSLTSTIREAVEPILVQSSDFTPVEPDWLWYPYLPKNKLAFIEGDPGNGKTFLALHIAACITTGRALYGAQPTEPGNVLYLSAEDGLADTLALRLERAGADRSRIYHIQGIRRHGTLDEAIYFNDKQALNVALSQIKPRLVVWDPMQAFFPADVNINAANETRPHMTALRDLAEAHDTSMLIVRHHRKGVGPAIAKGMGSMDLSGAARSVLVVGLDEENPEHRILAHGKSSLAKRGPSLKFELLNTAVSWIGECEQSADDLALGEQQPKCSDAVEFLRDALSNGPREVKEIEQQASAQGITKRTLERARSKLHVKADRISHKSPWTIELRPNGKVTVESVA